MFLAPSEGADPQAIQTFLLGQFGVVDASVWVRNGQLLASVTVAEESRCGEADLLVACRKALGPENTPQMILMQRALRRAA
ncbi:MAG: hypothetical protein JSS66_11105 [Armatimonadetes bacterium]|nr:hypothetical protein [Armatimonadota bacterium]